MSQIAHSIPALARCGHQYCDVYLEPQGLKGSRAHAMLVVCNNPGISQDALSRRIFLNKSNVARQVAALEEGGLLERRPDPADKRAVQLFPTEAGMALQPLIRSAFCQWEGVLTAGLSEKEIEVLKDLLARLKKNARAWMEEN